MYSGKFIVVFVGAFVALAAGVPADRKSPQFPGIPDGVPKPPMPMLNRLVRQAPEAPAPPSGFMLAASELAYENGAPSARIMKRSPQIPGMPDGMPMPPIPMLNRLVRSIPFHSESSKQVAQEVIYTNVVSVEREKRGATKKGGKKTIEN